MQKINPCRDANWGVAPYRLLCPNVYMGAKNNSILKMTAKQLQRLLESSELSQRGTAKKLGLNERTMRRYVSGDQPIPRVVEFAVRYLVQQKAEK